MRLFICFLIIVAIPVLVNAATLKVPSQYPTIQDAIDAASAGDTVLVASGTYVENIDFIGKAIMLMSEMGAGLTTIDGNGTGSVVTFGSGEGRDSLLQGFTLTNGSGTFEGSWYMGGGVYCFQGSSPTIIDNMIEGNQVSDWGGGICCYENSSPLISNNIIRNNDANDGGGAYYRLGSNPTMVNNAFLQNTATYRGGGINVSFSLPGKISNNILSENSAYFGGAIGSTDSSPEVASNAIYGNNANFGAGITCLGGSPGIINNVLYGNTAVTSGGGIYMSSATSPITNNTVYGNSANLGGGLCVSDNAWVSAANNIFWNNDASKGKQIALDIVKLVATLEISYSDLQGGSSAVYVGFGCILHWGGGMIDDEPLFTESTSNDFHLTFPSPCRGSGDNMAPGLTDKDFEGDPRIAYGTVDMGADEFYTHLYFTGDTTPGGIVEVKVVGMPGTSPVGLCIGTGILEPPIPSIWGDWYLQFPIIGPIDLWKIPSPDGVLIIPGTIPVLPPPPYSIPMQALIGAELSNLCVLEIK